MTRARLISPTMVTILVAIGCGSGRPQNAAARTDSAADTQAGTPVQLADAQATSQPAAGRSASAVPGRGSASIQSLARFSGAPPQREAVNSKMSADPICQQQHATPIYTDDVAVDDQGRLKNVFVYVKSGLSGTFPAPATPVTLNQIGCWYQPHVFGIQVDQPLEIVNSDATLHNINAKPVLNQPFNVAQPVKGMKTTKKFSKPELPVKFKCNVHPWMNAYAGVVEHPFFGVSDDHGAVAISGLPAGTYVLEAWHEKYGTQTHTVTVSDGETKSIEWTFQAQ